MTENLADMINAYRNENGPVEATEEITGEATETAVAEVAENTVATTEEITQEAQVNKFSLISLTDWLSKYREVLTALGVSKLALKKELIKSEDSLIFAVVIKDSTNPEEVERDIFLIKEAKKIKVPDIKPTKVMFFNNGSLRIDYQYSDTENADPNQENYFIKAYISKTSAICTYCVYLVSTREISTDENGNPVAGEEREVNSMVPYYQAKYKKDSTHIDSVNPDYDSILEKVAKAPDIEALIIQYNQFDKVRESIHTNLDAIKWLVARQEAAIDMNHQLKIDDVILQIFK